jgi:hypothetical protein
MAQLYNIPYENHFFHLTFSNFDYIGSIPEAKFFGEFRDSIKQGSQTQTGLRAAWGVFKSLRAAWGPKKVMRAAKDLKKVLVQSIVLTIKPFCQIKMIKKLFKMMILLEIEHKCQRKLQEIIVSCFEKLLEGHIEPSRGPHAARGPRVWGAWYKR